MSDRLNDLQVGINILGKIINKPINFCVSSTKESIFNQLKNVDLYNIKGNHPAGNESFQINRIDPINSGEVVWVVKPEDLANIGSFFKTGQYCSGR